MSVVEWLWLASFALVALGPHLARRLPRRARRVRIDPDRPREDERIQVWLVDRDVRPLPGWGGGKHG